MSNREIKNSCANPAHYTVPNFSPIELRRFELLAAPSISDIILYQQVINNYHKRMKQQQHSTTTPLSGRCVNPPNIAKWPRKRIYSVMCNYSQFLWGSINAYILINDGMLRLDTPEKMAVASAICHIREQDFRDRDQLLRALDELWEEGGLKPLLRLGQTGMQEIWRRC